MMNQIFTADPRGFPEHSKVTFRWFAQQTHHGSARVFLFFSIGFIRWTTCFIEVNHCFHEFRSMNHCAIFNNVPFSISICSMYGIITYKSGWFSGQMLVNILYMEHKEYSWLVVSTLTKSSQLGWLFPIYGNIKVMFQTTNQISIYLSIYIYIPINHHFPMVFLWFSMVFMKLPRFKLPASHPSGAGRLSPQKHLNGDVDHRTSELLLIFSAEAIQDVV